MSSRDCTQTLVGYIVPEKEENREKIAGEESETDEEEDKQPEFLDMKEMDSVSSGGFMFQSSVPALSEVNFMASGQKCRVQGRFMLTDPWWEISCTAKRCKSKFVVKGCPSYSLRTHLEEEGRTIVSLFLNACGVVADFVTQFMTWLPPTRYVDPTNVVEALNDFGEQSEELRKATDCNMSLVSMSVAGFYVKAASMYPYLIKYMPTLLPRQFLNLLNKGREVENRMTPESDENTEGPTEKPKKTSMLSRLEELIKTDVWKLGFGFVMWKEFRLVRCEATVRAFKDCNLFSKIPVLQQNALYAYDDLRNYCRENGHTYVERERLQERMRKMYYLQEESTWEAVDFLRKQGVVKVERQKIALRNFYKYETEIVDCLSKVAMGEPWKIDLDVKQVLRSAQYERMRAKADAEGPSALEQNGEEDVFDLIDEELDPDPIELDPDQVRAAEMMCANPVTVISGKGGCGKTFVVSLIFKAAMQKLEKNEEANRGCEESEENDSKPPLKVLLTAPTGRAASLLTKRTSFTAYTMHQVLWSFMKAKKNPGGEPINWRFAHVRVLVVDEGSLVCVQILHSLLTMLTEYAKLQKFILLGDIRQLPSIEPGNALNDLFQSLQRVRWAIEMNTNHRAESELIVRNAGLIADMGLRKTFCNLDFDDIVDLSKPNAMLPSPDKKFILILLPAQENDDDLQMSVKKLLEGRAPGLKDDRSSQFIAFMRSECNLINELCCKHYSGHTTKNHKKKIEFQTGDKVCCTKNGYVNDQEEEKKNNDVKASIDETQMKQQERKKLCNGEIFFIKEDMTTEEVGKRGSKRRDLTLCDEFGKFVLTADFRELQRECKLRHAWARTIHTFQGSEENTIVYVLGESSRQNWKHVYTAVTRGRQRVYVIAKRNGLKKAIRGQVIKRNTRLAGLVTDLVSKLKKEREDLDTQPNQSQFETPKKGSSFQPFQSPQKTSPNRGLFQPSSSQAARPCYKDGLGQNLNNADNGFGEHNDPPSGNPSPCKRQRSTDNCATPIKQLKTDTVDSPLGCSRLGLLSLDSHTPKPHGKCLFQEEEAPQSVQNQPQ